MANRSLLTLDLRNTWFIYLFSASVALTFSGCASIPNMSALENDELYLSRGEEFVTDAQYLAFALEEAGYEEESGSDYYDPTRSSQANGMISGYRPSFMSNQNAMQWGMGLSSGSNPFGYGMSNGYDPYMNSGFGYNPYGGMGYGNSGFGYNPYGGYGGYNPYAYGGYNPYGGYNGYNNGYNNGFNPYGGGYNPYSSYGNWTGNDSNQGGSTVTGFTRTPIMSNTAGGSNYTGGLLNRPKNEVVSGDASWAPSNAAPVSDRTPATTNSENTRGANRRLESPSTPLHSPADVNPSGRTAPKRNTIRNRTRANQTSSYGSVQPSTTPTPRNNSNSSARPSNNSSNGSSRPAGTSRSNRGGGH